MRATQNINDLSILDAIVGSVGQCSNGGGTGLRSGHPPGPVWTRQVRPA